MCPTDKDLEQILEESNARAKRTQRKLLLQNKILKICTLIIVISFAFIAYGVFFK